MLAKIVELIRLTSTTLAPEVLVALKAGQRAEAPASPAAELYAQFLENAELAAKNSLPLCQDTGLPTFRVRLPAGETFPGLEKLLREGIEQATKRAYLRPNAVDTRTEMNSGTGVGRGIPQIEVIPWSKPYIEIGLMLKGGGSENAGVQFSLPHAEIKAERDLNGVKKCVLEAVFQAQGAACPPYFLGVGIGGDRASSWKLAKEQFWRPLAERRSPLKDWENDVLRQVNRLGIGPMGVGGRTTALSVKADYYDRLPASYFVSVAFTCWVFRRRYLILEGGESRYV